MAIDDPKIRMKSSDPDPEPVPATMAAILTQMATMQQETARLLLEMRTSGSTQNAGAIESLLAMQEKLLVKTRPENAEHPGISVYSYPEGDVARPKPALKCKFIWCGQEETLETLTPEEIELHNRLEPGNYFVTKANGVKIKFNVQGKYTDGGKLEEMAVWFSCKNEHKGDHMSNVAYMKQVLGEAIPSVDDLMAELTRLKAELASAAVGAARVN